ncbi:hypothetical protein GGR42_000061 [Saonia flava]|uniref:Gluconate 2-dehydrogenase subunit 3 family protein n=1 Tax=Saonia flava TaxID=523696 RepID=A0A846QYA4_9FLAO|nr:gluconate 2-dehydrogenase subunit 3 family protein [Saonia flava]NJB69599.1 hypothetical protein [Saonia flava]
MNRRNSLKKLVMASAGLVALPAWAQGWEASTIELPQLFPIEEQEILTAVADTIIPTGDSVGALSVGVEKFLQRLFADCYEQDVQDNIKVQLNALDASANNEYEQSFVLCDQSQREALLLALTEVEESPESNFFNLVKNETIRGFRTSRKVMMDHLDYVMAPGYYNGCVDVKETETARK